MANYHVLGRVFYYVPYFSPFHPGRVLTTFGFLSAIVEALNAIGVSYIANPAATESRINTGQTIMKVSLIAQILVISCFLVLAAIFYRRCSKANIKVRPVTGPMVTLYISTAIILARTIYRLVEHFGTSAMSVGLSQNMENLSPMLRYEWYFYVFEAGLMLINTCLWNVRHPRRYLPQSPRTYLAQDGSVELEGPGWDDTRPWLVTLVDPFGFMASGKEKTRPPFWETNGYAAVKPEQRGLVGATEYEGASGDSYGRTGRLV